MGRERSPFPLRDLHQRQLQQLIANTPVSSRNSSNINVLKRQRLGQTMTSLLIEDDEWSELKTEMRNRVGHIINTCKDLENEHTFLKSYEGNKRRLQKLTQRVNFLTSVLREMEAMDPRAIETTYYWIVDDIKNLEQEARQVTYEYKSGMLDPAKDVVKAEREFNKHKMKSILKRK